MSYCFATCTNGIRNAAPGGESDGDVNLGYFTCDEAKGGVYISRKGSGNYNTGGGMKLPLKGGKTSVGPKSIALLVKHGEETGPVPRELMLQGDNYNSIILNSEEYPKARGEFATCPGSKKFLGPISNVYSKTEFVLVVLRSGALGTAMFRNGVKIASNDCTNLPSEATRLGLGFNEFIGTFKSFAMWNRELSDQEIASLDPTKLTC